MTMDPIRNWRFTITDWDGVDIYMDAEGGSNGNEPQAEFVGNERAAIKERERSQGGFVGG